MVKDRVQGGEPAARAAGGWGLRRQVCHGRPLYGSRVRMTLPLRRRWRQSVLCRPRPPLLSRSPSTINQLILLQMLRQPRLRPR